MGPPVQSQTVDQSTGSSIATAPGVPGGVTVRGLVVGAVAATALGLGCSYATMVLRGSYMALDFTTPGALFILLILVVLSGGVLRRFAAHLALTPAELTTAYIMLLVASAIPTMGFTAQIIPIITAPHYFATPENKWADLLLPHLPSWTAPSDPQVIAGLYEGWAAGAPPWKDWAMPLLAWVPFIGALHFGMICLMVVFRRQWVDNERLPYPVTQLPLAMATGHDSGSERPFFRQPIMWIGFAVPLIFASLIGLHHYFPTVPQMKVAWTLPMFRRHATMIFRISFPMLGFFYMVPLDTLLSLWVLNRVAFCVKGILGILGLELGGTLIFGTNSSLFAHLGFGAMVALVVTGLRVGRFHLADVWGKAWGRRPDVDDSGEIMSYRTAVFGGLACVGVMCGWLSLCGMPLWLTLAFMLIALTLFFGLTRVVAESGVAEAVAAAIAPGMSTCIFGTRAFGNRGLVTLGLTHVWNSDIRTLVMASSAHGLKLSSTLGLGGPRLLLGMVLALVLAAAASVFVTLRQAYTEGGLVLNSWFFNSGPNTIFRWTTDKISNPTGPHYGGIAVAGLGSVLFLFFTMMRQRFSWWPFHQIALAIAPVWIMDQLWFMAFTAWLLKMIILRYGGLKTYGTMRSIFLGLILGQYTANGIWLFIDHFAGTRGNQIFWI